MKIHHVLFILLALAAFSCGKKKTTKNVMEMQMETMKKSQALEEEIGARVRSTFQPMAEVVENPDNPITPAKVKLGKMLYYDNRLSKNNTQSCNTCHNLATFGVDNENLSEGDNGGLGDRNSPTVYNAAFHTTQFWDGRASDVEEQAGLPILNPVEMDIPSEAFLMERLSKTTLYPPLFAEAFPEASHPMTFENLMKAIAAFERTLVTPSRFDEYLKGNASVLTLEEKEGLKTFMEVGCTTCHMGSQLGGNMFQKFGVYEDYWTHTKSDPIDEGRAKETGQAADQYMFKVPGLRNIVHTAPYFHDGSVEDLGEAIRIIAKVNLNKDLTDEQVAQMLSFMGALTGEINEEWTTVPEELKDQI
jgi:cytochrome c peroxidase